MEDYTIDKNDIPDAHVWKEAYKREVAKNRELKIQINNYKNEIKRKDAAIQAFKAWQANVAKRNYEYWLGEAINYMEIIPSKEEVKAIKTMLNGYFGWEKMEEKVQKTYDSLIKAKNKLENTIVI